MSYLAADLRAAGQGIASRIAAGVAALRRVTLGVALLRLLIVGCVLGASALTLPEDYLLARSVVVPIGLAVVVALAPRTPAVSVALLAVAGLWLLIHDNPPLWKVLALAALLYVAHAAATLAAVVPYDCAIAPAVLARWALRTGAVVGVSLAVGAAGMALTSTVRFEASVVAPIAGALAAAGLVGLLVWLVAQRPLR